MLFFFKIWSAALARNVPVAAQPLRSFAVVSGKDIPSPKVEEIQFNVIGDPNVEYPSRPWETPSKEQLLEGVLQKARETQQTWDSKTDPTSPDALLLKNIFDLKPVRYYSLAYARRVSTLTPPPPFQNYI